MAKKRQKIGIFLQKSIVFCQNRTRNKAYNPKRMKKMQRLTIESDINNLFRSQKDYDQLTIFVDELEKKQRLKREDVAAIHLYRQLVAGENLSPTEKKLLKSWLQIQRQTEKLERLKDKKAREEQLQKIENRKKDAHKKALIGAALLSSSNNNGDYSTLLLLALEGFIKAEKFELLGIDKVQIRDGVAGLAKIFSDKETKKIRVAQLYQSRTKDDRKAIFYRVVDSQGNIITESKAIKFI